MIRSILNLIAHIDRQSVSYAKLQMIGDVGVSEYAFSALPSSFLCVTLGALITFVVQAAIRR
jgi:hypothetical protein